MQENIIKKRRIYESMIWISLGLGAVYWIVDAVLTVLTSTASSFVHTLLREDIIDFWRRLIVLCFFVIFGSHVQYTNKKRRESEEALWASEAHYRLLADHMKDHLWIMDLNLKPIYISPSVEKSRGYKLEEIAQLPLDKQLTATSLQSATDYFSLEMPKVLADPSNYLMSSLELEFYRKDGSTFWLESMFSLIRDKNGTPLSLMGVGRDITDQKQAEKDLRESEERFRNFLQNIPNVAVQAYGPGGITQYWNQASEVLYGYTAQEALGRNILDIIVPPEIHDDVKQAMKQMAETGQPIPASEMDLMRKDGSRVAVFSSHAIVQLSGRESELFCIDIDLTERKRSEEEKVKLEKQLFQAQKMEAIGTMSGGIAHDFNNILGIIVGYTEMALNENRKEKQGQYLQKTLEGAERAKDVIKQLLTFSRKDSHERKPLDLKFLVKEAVKFIRASIPATIEIHQNLTKESCNILADPTQMHQIVMNLCSNAAHAMKRTGGILKIELSNVEVAQGDLSIHHELNLGRYAKLTVSDTGHGIDPDLQQRIFDPFYTTKSKEEGTGLGLSVVYGIVKSHNGIINVYSQMDKGASFNIHLPLIIHAETAKIDEGIPITGGAERILFVDDEPALVDLGTHMLSSLGYKVTGMTSSVEALHCFMTEPQRFDIVITDMTLPKMTGIVLSRKILKIRPDIPIILCSGMRDSETEEKAKSLGIRSYLTKPLAIRELSRVIRDTLGGHEKHIS